MNINAFDQFNQCRSLTLKSHLSEAGADAGPLDGAGASHTQKVYSSWKEKETTENRKQTASLQCEERQE